MIEKVKAFLEPKGFQCIRVAKFRMDEVNLDEYDYFQGEFFGRTSEIVVERATGQLLLDGYPMAILPAYKEPKRILLINKSTGEVRGVEQFTQRAVNALLEVLHDDYKFSINMGYNMYTSVHFECPRNKRLEKYLNDLILQKYPPIGTVINGVRVTDDAL